ncbi:radical SAM protein [bacterium]|nr:radical SAM protein [bacterium]
MKVVSSVGREDIAIVYIAETTGGRGVEFVESIQPPVSRDKKWVLIVSTLFGCPCGCKMCDAGGGYRGRLSAEQIFFQIDYMIKKRYPEMKVPAEKFKIQFARMGEPALNPNVLDVLSELPERYNAPGLMPAVSTIAPAGSEEFFERLLEIKEEFYEERFQLQFSIHSTDPKMRDWLIPMGKWGLEKIARYGNRFFRKGDRKITLNFALTEEAAIDSDILRRYFDPENYLIKITPVNPTERVEENELSSYLKIGRKNYDRIDKLKYAGYDVVLSVGELEENSIGSNCGQYVSYYLKSERKSQKSYSYGIRKLCSLT